MQDQVVGPYRLRTLVRQAPSGARWRAVDPAGVPVELTLLSAAREADPETRRRFLEQVTRLAAVRSPHLVPVEVGEHEGRLFVVSRPPDGLQDLPSALSAFGTLGFAAAATVLTKVGAGLLALSEAGLAHGRLRPSAISFDIERADVAVLGGYAALDGLLVGEYEGPQPDEAFLAPEQRAGLAATPAADAWGLAQLFVTCLSGAPAPDDPQERQAVLEGCLQPVHRPAFAHALQVRAAERTPSPAALFEEIAAAQEAAATPDAPPPEAPTDAQPPAEPVVEAGTGTVRRRRRPRALAAGAVLVAVAGLAFAWWPSSSEAPPRTPPAQGATQEAGTAAGQVFDKPVQDLRDALRAWLPPGTTGGCLPLPQREVGLSVAALRCTTLPLDGVRGPEELLVVRWRTPEAMAADWRASYLAPRRYARDACGTWSGTTPGTGRVSTWASSDGTVSRAPLACYVNRAEPPAAVVLWEYPDQAVQVLAVSEDLAPQPLAAWSRSFRAR
ncbi:MAG: pknH 2 [Frankiales bacterium]|nr:pknH 2 [Frankiales bacterium]